MNKYSTQGIVISRTEFGEADRIIAFLTAGHGKVRAIAKGVRKPKSKLAGGVELFSVSDLTFLIGRGDIQTLMSSRLAKHYGSIVKDLARTQVGYELIRIINKVTEDAPEEAYFRLLEESFAGLDDLALSPQITNAWFDMQLLKLTGHAPNLNGDHSGSKLTDSAGYDFHFDSMCFIPKENGHSSYKANHIKFLRLGFRASRPQILGRVENAERLTDDLQPLLQSMLRNSLRI